MSEHCKTCLDTPLKLCSIFMSIIVVLSSLASFFLVLYFGGLAEAPFIPKPTPSGNITSPSSSSVVLSPSSSANVTGGGGDCNLSSGGGLSVLGFLLINHGIISTFLGVALTVSWYATEKFSMFTDDLAKSITWFASATTLLGLALTFYVPDLGGPTHMTTAVIYLTIVSFSYLMSILFCLRKCCIDSNGDKYNPRV